MTHGQRRVHRRVWTGLALLLPVSVAVIVAQAGTPPTEVAPLRIDPPAHATPAAGSGG